MCAVIDAIDNNLVLIFVKVFKMFTTKIQVFILQLWWKHNKNSARLIIEEFDGKYPGKPISDLATYLEAECEVWKHRSVLYASSVIFHNWFKLNVIQHNWVYLSYVNPHIWIQEDLNGPGVMVWGCISSTALIGPYFFEGIVISENATGSGVFRNWK